MKRTFQTQIQLNLECHVISVAYTISATNKVFSVYIKLSWRGSDREMMNDMKVKISEGLLKCASLVQSLLCIVQCCGNDRDRGINERVGQAEH